MIPDDEERKSSPNDELSSVSLKPNIIKNESSSNGYASDEDHSKSDKNHHTHAELSKSKNAQISLY